MLVKSGRDAALDEGATLDRDMRGAAASIHQTERGTAGARTSSPTRSASRSGRSSALPIDGLGQIVN